MTKTTAGFAAQILCGGWITCNSGTQTTQAGAEADRTAALALNPNRRTRIVQFLAVHRGHYTEIQEATVAEWNPDGSPA